MQRVVVITPSVFLASVLSDLVWKAFGCASEVHGPAADGLAAMRAAKADLVVIDPDTEDLDGLDYVPEIIADRLASVILVATQRADERTLVVLRRLSIDAWIDMRSENVAGAYCVLRAVSSGRRYASPSIIRDWSSIRDSATERRLSQREELIFSLLGSGIDNDQAAVRLGISPDTVRTHRRNIMAKLGLSSRSDLIRHAHHRGYVRTTPGKVLHPGFENALNLFGRNAEESRPVRQFAPPRIASPEIAEIWRYEPSGN